MSTNWDMQAFDLPENHGWSAKPGNRIFIGDKGAIRFEVPDGWIMEFSKDGRAFLFFDRKPTQDANIRLDVRVRNMFAMNPNVDWFDVPPWDQPPITEWLKKNMVNDERNPIKVGPPFTINLDGMTVTWGELDFIDPLEKRLAHTRLCYAMKTSVALLSIIAMDFWHEQSPQAHSAWNDMLGTLKLGEFMESPFYGPGHRGPG